MGPSAKTYISLFSSAGVGCYGFKQEGFDCIATNELIPRRLDIQKFNSKCKYDSGYISGDITLPSTKKLLLDEVAMWRDVEKIDDVTVLMATPPCQGMSVANHKKTSHEIQRNSLVVESLSLIQSIRPRFFVLENVPRFLKTFCVDNDEEVIRIGNAIHKHLDIDYSIFSKVINFKNYGSNSSRPRTLVIGVRKDLSNRISPLILFPDYSEEKKLIDVIGHLPRLHNYGEIDHNDVYHAFREYPEHMRSWIHDIAEGQSAFDNVDLEKQPHSIVDGKIKINVNKNGDKYTRQYWDKVGPCIHTRNDQLASQNTIHPSDDRVFSIRELMLMMSIPESFKWTDQDIDVINSSSVEEKKRFLKKNETNIRQCIGEAVPTAVIRSIAAKISSFLSQKNLKDTEIAKLILSEGLDSSDRLLSFLRGNLSIYNYTTLSKIVELANASRVKNAAYFTDLSLITEIMCELPDLDGCVNILEPSVGAGNFIPSLIRRYDSVQKVTLDLVDIDPVSIECLKLLLSKLCIPKNFKVNYIVDDFLLHKFDKRYDLVVGNPPFSVIGARSGLLKAYREFNINKKTRNTFEFFIEKALRVGNKVSLVSPKTLIYAPEFNDTRFLLSSSGLLSILDFGECGFKKVLVETINIVFETSSRSKKVHVKSVANGIDLIQDIRYITDSTYPYWILYRDRFFDSVATKLEFGLFTCFRDRQITNSMLSDIGDIPVLRSRNLSSDGKEIVSVPGYDKYIPSLVASKLAVFEYLNKEGLYMTPNMTYYPRLMRKPKGVLVNGSVAILIPVVPLDLSSEQMDYIASDEYRKFYAIARNYQTRSLNIESNSVYFFGVLKDV